MGAPEYTLLCLVNRDTCSRDAWKAYIVFPAVNHVLRQQPIALARPWCLVANHLSTIHAATGCKHATCLPYALKFHDFVLIVPTDHNATYRALFHTVASTQEQTKTAASSLYSNGWARLLLAAPPRQRAPFTQILQSRQALSLRVQGTKTPIA